jgi:SPP1 gp7 family putative phage head morphogenesis protein
MGAALGFDVPFEAAIAWARARRVTLPDVFYSDLQRAARTRAFTVSTLDSLDTIQGVLDSLNRATEAGSTFAEWQALAGDIVETLVDSHQEVVFRNAVQTAYGIGHTVRQRENASTRPFLMWDALNDARTRPAHAEMDGFIAPINDPVWLHWHVPAGFNCRCARISLTTEQAHARGYPMPHRAAQPDRGFDGPDPADSWDDTLDGLLDARTHLLPKAVRDAVDRTRGGG